ncbi:ABC transporter ATP-binding protein [Candidatus Micrarchaeota archaeon]|nr:ABC transporter ATP-binding protein [Candidatus Micrarchaeota archaeon]
MISVRNVVKEYVVAEGRKIVVLDGVSFNVHEKEFVAVLGPNGCGKSTLLKLLAGFEKAEDGSILVGSTVVSGPSTESTLVFQEPALFEWKTVYENVAFPLKSAGEKDSETVERLLELMNLKEFAGSYPCRLSSGMKQKVSLARALASKARVLLLDEPLAAIDAHSREFLQEEMEKIWLNTNKTAVMVTHDIREALFLADRIIVLTQRPAQVQAIVDVPFPRPRHPSIRFTQEFHSLFAHCWKLLRNEYEKKGEVSWISVQ